MKLENHPCKWWSIYLWSWLIILVLAGRGICFISKPGAFKSCRVYREWIMTWNLYPLGAHSDQTNHPPRWFRGMNPLSSHDWKNGRWGGNREGSNKWKGAKFSRWCSEVVELRRNSATFSADQSCHCPTGCYVGDWRDLFWGNDSMTLKTWWTSGSGLEQHHWWSLWGPMGSWQCMQHETHGEHFRWLETERFYGKTRVWGFLPGLFNMLRLVLWQVHFALAFKQRLGGFVTRLVPWRLRGTRGGRLGHRVWGFKPGWCWWWWSKGYNQPWKPRSYLSHTVNSI